MVSVTQSNQSRFQNVTGLAGLFWLFIACAGGAVFFADGLEALRFAWSLPEYSHGPLIPILSGLLFLRQLKDVPIDTGQKKDRWPGVIVIAVSLGFAALGKLSHIPDIVAYGTIIWIYGILLISFGWDVGKHFWPPVLHLVFMLPLPDTLYFKMNIWLQFISSEIGVSILRFLSVPVFLEGNIIDLGVYKLHVAEACSGLRYLFPIMSFSYIFAVLYKGPMWHKAVLLISAAPITVLMNSVRIGIAGYIVNHYGVGWIEGFTHFFEGWVIFIACIILLFGLARIMLFFNDRNMTLAEALDLETEGLVTQAMRIRLVQPSAALITAALVTTAAAGAWQAMPERDLSVIERESFVLFPRQFGEWEQLGPRQTLESSVVVALGADDYHSIALTKPGAAQPVGFFSAWYADQASGGVHSPEVCLPGGGWEIAWLERTDMTQVFGTDIRFMVNRAVIQKGQTRMMVYYWFEQKGRRVAWDMRAKFMLMVDGVRTGRTDGGLVRLTTLIDENETEADAEARLREVTTEMIDSLPRFIPSD